MFRNHAVCNNLSNSQASIAHESIFIAITVVAWTIITWILVLIRFGKALRTWIKCLSFCPSFTTARFDVHRGRWQASIPVISLGWRTFYYPCLCMFSSLYNPPHEVFKFSPFLINFFDIFFTKFTSVVNNSFEKISSPVAFFFERTWHSLYIFNYRLYKQFSFVPFSFNLIRVDFDRFSFTDLHGIYRITQYYSFMLLTQLSDTSDIDKTSAMISYEEFVLNSISLRDEIKVGETRRQRCRDKMWMKLILVNCLIIALDEHFLWLGLRLKFVFCDKLFAL